MAGRRSLKAKSATCCACKRMRVESRCGRHRTELGWLRAPATTELALARITANVSSGDGACAEAPKDRTRDWKSLALGQAAGR